MKIETTIARFRGLGVLREFGEPRLYGLRLLLCLVMFNVQCSMFNVFAQTGTITIGGNVYGGGNSANVDGKATVTVNAGTVVGDVYGGARMANVGGRVFVNINGEADKGDILLSNVYGGNDISGTIGTSDDTDAVPTELTQVKRVADDDNPKKNAIDNSWNTYVRTTRSSKIEDGEKKEHYAVVIGSLFGGGNGEYEYELTGETETKKTYNVYNKPKVGDASIATITVDKDKSPLPELGKTYLEVKGGLIAHLYGGGNNATVTENTTIHIENESDDLGELINVYADYMVEVDPTHDKEWHANNILASLMAQVKLPTFQAKLNNLSYSMARVFGGNNKADMAIRPKWNLQSGKIRDLYSGGNEGSMTCDEGLLLEIDPAPMNTSSPYSPDEEKNDYPLKVTNVYGGCRRADVRPTDASGEIVQVKQLPGYSFPTELSARTLVRGGQITNVYGGNDISGRVYGGNAVGIYTSVYGDVYGGGNGSYAYTDNSTLGEMETYKDFYYDPGGNSIEALNAHRPNAEQVSIRLKGTESKPTIIHGSVFCGGNSASLKAAKSLPRLELKMGSYVYADKVFLGNNGEKMIDPYILELYAKKVDNNGNIDDGGQKYSTLNLKDHDEFASYMDGVVMTQNPDIVFDSELNGDPNNYEDGSSYIGSFYCGGNVGSMAIAGKNTYSIEREVIIYEKLVGGCNNADVAEGTYNAAYDGGILGAVNERGATSTEFYTDTGTESGKIRDRLELNLSNIEIQPKRWKDAYVAVPDGQMLTAGNTYYYTDDSGNYIKFTSDGTEESTVDDVYYELDLTKSTELVWNTAKYKSGIGYENIGTDVAADDEDRRLLGGNVYGGCYNSGHVNGNVVININENLVKKDKVFGESNVDLEGQRDDILAVSMSVFGAGKGEETEIWGSTTVNHNKGYCFQIFGGGEQGVVGKKDGSGDYTYNPGYSSTVNLRGQNAGYSEKETGAVLAETEYIYGGGNEGDVCGNTYVYLGNGRIYDAFGGASDADILGHTEVYIGKQPKGDGTYKDGFPWVRDIVYGGSDFGGEIHGNFEDGYDFTNRIRDWDNDKTKIHGYEAGQIPNVLKGTTYVEYLVGRVDTIYGGGYGYYDYSDTETYGPGCSMPVQHSSFVNIRPKLLNDDNYIGCVFGGGTGYPGNREGDKVQDCSYVFIDIPNDMTEFITTDVFGSGSYNGLGMRYTPAETFDGGFDLDKASAVIDLVHGEINNVYGGSYNEGNTRRTVVNVPVGSDIRMAKLFGGAYGTNPLPPCDVYEANVNYRSADATAKAIYGGNNASRRTLYSRVNISSPFYTGSVDPKTKIPYTGTVYGAGFGDATWSEYTEVNLENGARVYKVYGGGEQGQVLNAESVQAYMQMFTPDKISSLTDLPPHIQEPFHDRYGSDVARWAEAWKRAWKIGEYYIPDDAFDNYIDCTATNLDNPHLVRKATEIADDKTAEMLGNTGKKYNTNVIISEGAVVEGYAYGGGLGSTANYLAGSVIGASYVALLGGTVSKDIYAAGQTGSVFNVHGASFTATANAYIPGGTARNVYGGSYLGNVGYHDGAISTAYTGDILGESNVVIGKVGGSTFSDGMPAITRNVYGGGEGGSVFGTSNVTINNGYIGYRYKNTAGEGETPVYEYVEELDDQSPNAIELAGNVFGGGYVVNSYVDYANVTMYGGTVRGCLYGGGEIGPIGRGTMKAGATGGIKNNNATIYKAGKTHVQLFDGWVKRNVFGGGRGKDSWGGDGTKFMDPEVLRTVDLKCKGYVFGQTEVDIYGGEVGTEEGMARGYGNVFGAGDIGFVYSAYELADGTLCIGKKPEGSYRYDGTDEGYYYKYESGDFVLAGAKNEKVLTEDCKVLVEPWCKAKDAITLNGKTFAAGDYVPTSYLHYLGNKNTSEGDWAKLSKADKNKDGVIIHNAVFAGGNTSTGSIEVHASTVTVYGNATASIHDVYHRDLITVGTGHTGGLYGEGNLTLVDGYRELNITNYGTDYYNIKSEITKEQYDGLSTREQAYYEIRYRCAQTCKALNGRTYTRGSTISADEMEELFDGVEVAKRIVRKDEHGNIVFDDDGYPISDEVANEKYLMLPDGVTPQPAYWTQNGVCSRYAGRIMNTIQRADFCGVFGSRMVMKGAQDRVPSVVDYTNYTINRVREVSLNKRLSLISEDAGSDRAQHGNYFGIYSNVNFLGALTSDFDFGDDGSTAILGGIRTSSNENTERYQATANNKAYGKATFYDWKKEFCYDPRRNNGNSHNKVALASGVYLELTTELSKGQDLYEKDWGYITGVVELDLISVQPGLGGGFVYAKNIHGTRYSSELTQTILTKLNEGAITRKKYIYDEDDPDKEEWQTSGNFVHSTQTIIDDCYNIGAKYKTSYGPPDGVPAHYWYIKGSIYIYDQYISAYTGLPNAYSEVVNIPLTITSASHGRLQLLDVQPNYYAYYKSYTNPTTNTPLGSDDELVLRDVIYKLNDPITYWDWYMLSDKEKELFVEKTYVTVDSCKIGDTYYAPGYVMLPSEYEALLESATTKDLTPNDNISNPVPAVLKATIDEDGNSVVDKDGNKHDIYVAFADVFRESNNLSHDTGYLLTYKVNNPGQWDTWYTPKNEEITSGGKVNSEQIKALTRDLYEDGPTYTPKTTGLYGQQDYIVGNIISEDTHTSYATAYSKKTAGMSEAEEDAFKATQATFERAYIVTKDVLDVTNKNEMPQRFYEGAMLCGSDYSTTTWADLTNATTGSVKPAFMVTSTIKLSDTEYIYKGEYMTEDEKTRLYNIYKDGTDDEKKIAEEISKYIVAAYYCSGAGKYGGDYYETGHNYRGLETWSSMSEEERNNFNYNYDALDLLIDPTYDNRNVLMIASEAFKYQYDSAAGTLDGANANPAHYSLQTSIDYEATYKGDEGLTYTYGGSSKTITTGTTIGCDEYESLLNERYYYSPITVKKKDDDPVDPVYVVNKSMILGDIPYAAGQAIDKATYDALGDESKAFVTVLTFNPSTLSSGNNTFYYCRESYTIAAADDGGVGVSASNAVTSGGNTTNAPWTNGQSVPVGAVIDASTYAGLTNKQANFTIHGVSPTETSTLYVPRESDIDDVSTEKIITVVYQYDYVESDVDGMGIVPYSERHVLNIHLQFKSGVPIVEDIKEPGIILPGTTVSLYEPFVTPGAYEVTGGGWTLFDDPGDAESHINGIDYTPNTDPLYLYQDKYYVSYYAKTYLGRTYSNSVPVHVANYHDIKAVMDSTNHHYYIDHSDIFERLKVEPKIYIKDYSSSNKNGLDIFKSLYDLSVLTPSSSNIDVETGLINNGVFKDHKPLNERVKGGNKLEFFLQTDIEHTDEWTPIASGGDPCFQGTFHGDGHTLSGLDNSLFGKLCGEVYNLGVTGSFSSAGVADYGEGYVENCWINTTGTPNDQVYAVFGDPQASGKPKQIVNCYYQDREGTNYKTTPTDHGVATPKPQNAFYNGEVAYDLNGFYLYKRYCDKEVKSGSEYQNFTIGDDDKLEFDDNKVYYYASNPDLCSSGYRPSVLPEGYEIQMYVEDRFADGDFRYAGGTIPEEDDERLHTWISKNNETGEEREESGFFPIWPDDYIFFGQMLTYGYGRKAHQEVPTAVARDGGRLSQTADANRVYRAPAYFRSKVMNMAHFNPNAYLAQTKKGDPSVKAYPHMTAIDFAGHYDTHVEGGAAKHYELGWNAGRFYLPLLDDDGLLSIKNCDETLNLLAYAPAETAEAALSHYGNKKTYDVLNKYFTEPKFGNYYDSDDACTEYIDSKEYDRVADATSQPVFGHLVQSNKNATNDHLLVDKQDFNCPIAYKFDVDYLMWYQRIPDDQEYVDHDKGWQGISLPFSAELVTTDDKGEITHFYDGSKESKNDTGTKIGHEYWLRELENGGSMTLKSGTTDTLEAVFDYPSSSVEKTKTMNKTGKDAVTNTFLWDYYYQGLNHGHQDKNLDEYQTYYEKAREYKNYPLLTNGRPYIIGLPGKTYYEFDLSGTFDAKTTAPTKPDKLDNQVVSFVSEKGETIKVSDDEMVDVAQTYSSESFSFKPNYLNEEIDGNEVNGYVLNEDGDSYEKVAAAKKEPVSAFRPYFISAPSSPTKEYQGETRAIAFSRNTAKMFHEEEEDDISNPGKLIIKGKDGRIIVTSTLRAEEDVIVVTAAGALIDRYTIQPGETRETPVNASGVYIVNKKKVAMKIK